ncbi:MAG TPA: glycosyltransferase [Candidatus Saccharimonadales bacterium]|jgi:glycosyltransferase involved in cell wall biosynthesis
MAEVDPHTLHSDIFDRTPLIGAQLCGALEQSAQEVVTQWDGVDPDVSILIRTRNNEGRIRSLFDDISAQRFAGEVQVVVVDTESSDGTAQTAKRLGAEVVNIAQTDFNYPRALNMGVAVADHPYVFSIVGHSNLSNDQTLRGISRWHSDANLGGIYGAALPDANASKTEQALAFGLVPLVKAPRRITSATVGVLGANAAVVNKAAWSELGGFDEKFAAGGEDTELARRMLAAGMSVVHEPVLSVHHSHGLGPINTLRQALHWVQVARGAHNFDSEQLARRRPDLKLG